MSRLVPAFRPALVAAFISIATGCVPVKQDVKSELPKLVKGPETAPSRTITNFSPALRCMDSMMIQYGIYDVSMLVEDIKDSTDKVKAGAKDMLISAISEMTRRSHAIRLIAFGADSGNLVSFLVSANENTPYAVVPQYDIRGSISQLDRSIAAKDAAGGINISKVGIGGAKTANASVLALDLAIISTEDYSVLPGVVSKNTIVIFKEGKGVDADASIGKFGVNFSMNLTRSEGDAQALRNLIELAAIELVGKLTKVPYWTCLQIDPETPEVRNEVHDWYYNLVADQQVVVYFQNQLSNRGFYKGPIDGQFNAELTRSVADYKRALGMEEINGNINRELFVALLNRPTPKVPAEPAPTAAPPTTAQGAAQVRIRYADEAQSPLRPGEQFQVDIEPSVDAHLVCYFQDETGTVMRFFPNRFRQDSLVQSGSPLRLPGKMPFKLEASKRGIDERMACFSSPKPLMAQLPTPVKGTDFEALSLGSLEAIQSEFKDLVGDDLGVSYFEIDVN